MTSDLRSRWPSRRYRAAKRLASCDPPCFEALPELVDLALREPCPRVRAAAIAAYFALTGTAQRLRLALAHSSKSVREAALRAVGGSGFSSTYPRTKVPACTSRQPCRPVS